MTQAELILYATPTGPLGDALDALFRKISAQGPTTAQTYPPHCTLTGFFHRDEREIARIGAELVHALRAAGPMPTDAVEIVALHRKDDWIGLELSSPRLRALAERFVEGHRLDDGDDPLRPKDWLHLSIAYGSGDIAGAEAVTDLDIRLDVAWHVGLWQREADGTWSLHSHHDE